MNSPRLFLLAGLLALTACAQNASRLKAMEPKGDAFTAHLAREYRSYVLALSEDGELSRAEYFAAKGLRAVQNMATEPELAPGNTNTPLSTNTIESMIDARIQLLSHLKDSLPERHEALARAQVFFDCWVSEAIEHPSHAEGCHGSFKQAMESLQAITPQSPDYIIYFRSNSAGLTEGARNVIRQIAIDLYGTKVKKIKLTGFTDEYGDPGYNEELAAARAENVSAALQRAGIVANGIETELSNEKFDSVIEARGSIPFTSKRRVEVRILR